MNWKPKKPVTVFRTINNYMARTLARVFMFAYKQGVNDAYLHQSDEGMLREHVEQTSDGEKFGFVGNLTGSWVYWRNRLTDIADKDNRYGTMESYWKSMGRFKSNYLSVGLILAQKFYNKGITDYLDNPDAEEISVYNDKDLRWWGNPGKSKTNGYRLRAFVQDVCAEYTDRIDSGEENPVLLKRNQYDTFSQAFSFAIVARQ